MLLGTLGASCLGNLLTGKRVIGTRQEGEANMPGQGTIRASEGTIRAGKGHLEQDRIFNAASSFNKY